jgi:TRAP-type C4-dicarboxylate transport system permease small subunit
MRGKMRRILDSVAGGMSRWMEVFAGIVLISVMLLIGADIVGRIFGFPVPGTYEIVSLAGGLILGLSLPATSRAKEHVSADFLTGRISDKPRRILMIGTRFMSIAIFLLAGYGMIMMGVRLKEAGEVTAVLAFHFYYIAYALGGAFLIQPLILFSEIFATGAPKTER